VNFGLIRDLRDERVVSSPLFEEELILVACRDHPFSDCDSISIDRLRETVLITFDPKSSYSQMTKALLRRASVEPRAILEVDNIEIAKRMALRGLGAAFLPSTVVADALAHGSLVGIQVEGAGSIRRHILVIQNAKRPLPIPIDLWRLLKAIPKLIPGAAPPRVVDEIYPGVDGAGAGGT
jgi:DNA-binding transcriptional LysR family regulator